MKQSKAEHCRNLRYKRGALSSCGYDEIMEELSEIQERCSNVQYFMDVDDETLIDALDGDDDEAWEFKLMFTDLSNRAYQLMEELYQWDSRDDFDDCLVGLIGNRYQVIGFDVYEEDYFSLTKYEQELSQRESAKRILRHTKAEMISMIGQALGTTLAFFDLRQQYDYLKATMDILKDQNSSLLQRIRDIDQSYEKAMDGGKYSEAMRHFEAQLSDLPDRLWVE